MADDRRRDSGFEILGAVALLALILLLCALKIICPSGECSGSLIKCQNCEGGCCLPDGTCPCPTGSSPCKDVCPSSLNCPSGCCSPGSCQCTIVPECPPNSQWSSQRGCCVILEGVRSGECITVCTTDSSRAGGCTAGLDACDADNCCPLGSIGWDASQKCCIDNSGICMLVCTSDPSRISCPKPSIGGCDSGGCCPYGAHWDTVKSCCATQAGDCVCTNDDICKTCTGGKCGGIGPRTCTNNDNCSTSICSNGQCDGTSLSSGSCLNNNQCNICILGKCGGIGPRPCPNGISDCLGSTCSNGQCDGTGTSGGICSNSDQCKVCIGGKCGGIGPRLCPSGSSDCLGSTCSNGQCDGTGTSGNTCSNNDQCKVCNLTSHLCGGIGPRLCPNGNSDCLGSTCSNGQCGTGGTGSCTDSDQCKICTNSKCGGSGAACTTANQVTTCVGSVCNNGQCDSGGPSLVECTYNGTSLTTCVSGILCVRKCANGGTQCIDPRYSEGTCKTSSSCTSSVDCCCGLNCQFIPGEGNVCCSGGLFVCYSGEGVQVTQPTPTTINCGTNINCLISASTTCSPANVVYNYDLNTFGMIDSVSQTYIINGIANGKCSFYLITDKTDLTFSNALIQQMLLQGSTMSQITQQQQTANTTAQIAVGRYYNCAFIQSDLTSMLNRWAVGAFSFSTDPTEGDFANAICTGNYIG